MDRDKISVAGEVLGAAAAFAVIMAFYVGLSLVGLALTWLGDAIF